MGIFDIFKKGNKKKKFTRCFFATDLHGSTVTYRKLVNSSYAYDSDILVMGGDIIGKLLIPVITGPNGQKRVTLHGQMEQLQSEQDIKEFEQKLDLLGYYHAQMPEETFKEIKGDEAKIDRLLLEKANERLTEWVAFAEDRLKDTPAKIYVSGGNDDPTDSLEFLARQPSSHFEYAENKRIKISEHHTLVSLGVSNPTPWDTPREYPEEIIAQKIEEAVDGIDDFTNVIFNFHVPPFSSGLDACPELDATKNPPAPVMRGGQQVFKPVGSTAVRDAIEKYQPLLVLTGHIHEGKGTAQIGRTFVVNPGSEYGEGILRGAIVNLGDGEILSWQMTTG